MDGLPPRMKTHLRGEAYGAHTSRLHDSLSNIKSANNIVRHSAARQVDEPSPQQARAIDKILRLPKKP